jgi:hypothetical protein
MGVPMKVNGLRDCAATGYPGKIISVEPGIEAFRKLDICSKDDKY